MNKKLSLLILLIIVLIYSHINLNKNNNSIILKQKIFSNKISFFDLINNNEFIYTENNKTFKKIKSQKIELNNIILEKIEKKNKYYIAKKSDKFGVLSKDLKTIINFKYSFIKTLGVSDLLEFQKDSNKFLFNLNTFQEIGPFEDISIYNNGELIKTTYNSVIKYFNKKGDHISALDNYEVLFWRDNTAITVKNNKYGLIDIYNKINIYPDNEEVYFSNKNILIKKKNKYYLNNKELDINKIYPTKNDVLIYDLNNGFSIFDLKNLKKSDLIFDEINLNYNNYFIVSQNNKYAILNKYFNKSPNFKYNYILPAGSDSFAAGTNENNGLFALIIGDKQVTEEKYEFITNLVPGYYFAELNDELILLDIKGNELLKTTKKDLIYYDNKQIILNHNNYQMIYLL